MVIWNIFKYYEGEATRVFRPNPTCGSSMKNQKKNGFGARGLRWPLRSSSCIRVWVTLGVSLSPWSCSLASSSAKWGKLAPTPQRTVVRTLSTMMKHTKMLPKSRSVEQRPMMSHMAREDRGQSQRKQTMPEAAKREWRGNELGLCWRAGRKNLDNRIHVRGGNINLGVASTRVKKEVTQVEKLT